MNVDDTQEDAFGFESSKRPVRDRIREIVPAAPDSALTDIHRVDEIADIAGFVSRESREVGHRKRPRQTEPTVAVNMRVPLSVAQKFQAFCDGNRYTYPGALREIMRRAGLL